MLVKQSELNNLLKQLRAQGKTIVTTNGCFDILHVGHVRYLEKAKSFGDVLIVALNSDKSVKSIKGDSRPINNENDRAEILSALRSVDYVVLFDEDSPIELLLQIKPDVHTKGADYTAETLPEAKGIIEAGGRIEFISFVEGKSTTAVIEKMCKINPEKC
ncbi:MAG: D-glycero-beta-D-manno-heptose 1-phosphate adenylyltransferase [Candidatus Avigastranaerophilus sp.]